MNFFESFISPNSKEYVNAVLESTMLSEGKVVEIFERELEKTFNFKPNSVICVNSGTSALHLALIASGIKLRQEVILPAQTFVATGLAIKYVGANPIFADIGMDGNINLDDVEKKITKRTKVIIPVHWAGYPCDLDEINKIAEENNLIVIEDACQALGAIYKNKYIGNHSRFVCFSFQATKHLTTGDGGMLVCNNSDDYELIKKLRWFGISRKYDKEGLLGEREYNLDRIGFKYHMNNVAAAIGMANIETIKQRIRYRRFLAKIYTNELQSVHVFHSPRDKENVSSYWSFPIGIDNVEKFTKFCKEKNIPVSIIHRGIDNNKIFGNINMDLNGQRSWEKTTTHLPIHDKMTTDDVKNICKEVNKYVGI